jgi:hypothetical protein
MKTLAQREIAGDDRRSNDRHSGIRGIRGFDQTTSGGTSAVRQTPVKWTQSNILSHLRTLFQRRLATVVSLSHAPVMPVTRGRKPGAGIRIVGTSKPSDRRFPIILVGREYSLYVLLCCPSSYGS